MCGKELRDKLAYQADRIVRAAYAEGYESGSKEANKNRSFEMISSDSTSLPKFASQTLINLESFDVNQKFLKRDDAYPLTLVLDENSYLHIKEILKAYIYFCDVASGIYNHNER